MLPHPRLRDLPRRRYLLAGPSRRSFAGVLLAARRSGITIARWCQTCQVCASLGDMAGKCERAALTTVPLMREPWRPAATCIGPR